MLSDSLLLYSNLLVVVTSLIATATSIEISWTSPMTSQSVINYDVSVTRVTGDDTVLCSMYSHDLPLVTTGNTSAVFRNLEEFSTYSIIITAHLSGSASTSTETDIITLGSGISSSETSKERPI